MNKILFPILVVTALALSVYMMAPGWILDTTSRVMISLGGFESDEIEINGHQRPYLDNHRDGKPIVIFLHGYADRKESWFPFVNKFTNDYRIVIPDLMGHGDNLPNEGENFSLESQAVYLHDLIVALDIESFHLVGISMGGGVTGKYASRYDEGLRSATFISSAGIAGCKESSDLDQLMSRFNTLEEKEANFPLLPKTYSRANARRFKEYIFYKKFPIPNRLFMEYLKPVIEERDFYIDVLDDFVDIESGHFIRPLDEELNNIKVPVCVIWGKQDPLLDATCAVVFAEQLPNPPEMVMIENCGHATIVEQPRKTREALMDFLAKTIN